MKTSKKLLTGFLILIVALLTAAFFVKGDFKSEREITINKPRQEVFNYILMLKNQNNFSKWAQIDPNMKKTFTGTDGTVGFISAWDSDNKDVGKGAQEIKSITPGQRIDYEIRFEKPMKATNYAYMATDSISATQTKVRWGFNGKMAYPFNLVGLFMNMEKMIGDDLSVGLKNLKGIMEK